MAAKTILQLYEKQFFEGNSFLRFSYIHFLSSFWTFICKLGILDNLVVITSLGKFQSNRKILGGEIMPKIKNKT